MGKTELFHCTFSELGLPSWWTCSCWWARRVFGQSGRAWPPPRLGSCPQGWRVKSSACSWAWSCPKSSCAEVQYLVACPVPTGRARIIIILNLCLWFLSLAQSLQAAKRAGLKHWNEKVRRLHYCAPLWAPGDTCAFEYLWMREEGSTASTHAKQLSPRRASSWSIPARCFAALALQGLFWGLSAWQWGLVPAPLNSRRSCGKALGDYLHFDQFISVLPAKWIISR